MNSHSDYSKTSAGIINGIVIALVISLASGALSLFLGVIFAQESIYFFTLASAVLAYLIYLLKHSQAKVGGVLTICTWALASFGCWFFDASPMTLMLSQVTLIWIVRVLYFQHSILAALIDLGLIGAGLLMAAWALLNTGGLGAAIWSFLLAQSVFCWIPGLSKRLLQSKHPSPLNQANSKDPFQAAHSVALDAVRKLTQV